MTTSRENTDAEDLQRQIEQVATEAGVAEAIDLYEKTEAIYAQAVQAVRPAVIASNSTDAPMIPRQP